MPAPLPIVPLPARLPVCQVARQSACLPMKPAGPRPTVRSPWIRRLAALAAVLGLLLGGPLAQAQSHGRLTGTRAAAPQSNPVDEAQAALRARAPARALAIADQGLKVRPDDAQLLFTRGLALVALQRSDDAESTFRRLTQDYPELPEPHNNLAFVLAARGDLEGARMALDDAVRALPDYALAHENLGDILVRLAARHYAEAARLAAGANRLVAESATTKLRLVNEIQTGIVRPADAAPATPRSSSTPSP